MENLATSLLTNDELIAVADRILPPVDPIVAAEPLSLKVTAAAAVDVRAINLADTRVKGAANTAESAADLATLRRPPCLRLENPYFA